MYLLFILLLAFIAAVWVAYSNITHNCSHNYEIKENTNGIFINVTKKECVKCGKEIEHISEAYTTHH